MQISIKNHGPLKEKVTIAIDGEVITFSTCSFVKLENLMVALGAKPDRDVCPIKGESHWTLAHDDVRERAYQTQLRLAQKANEKMAKELSYAQEDAARMGRANESLTDNVVLLRRDNQSLQAELAHRKTNYDHVSALLASAVKERQAIHAAPWWKRLQWILGG